MTAGQLQLRDELMRIADDCEQNGPRDVPADLRRLAARLSGLAAVPQQWQPIETAPRDERARIELWIPEPTGPGYPTHGHWNSDHRARRPRPFWYYESTPSARDMRDWQPTHWRPEADPPHG